MNSKGHLAHECLEMMSVRTEAESLSEILADDDDDVSDFKICRTP